MNNGILRSLCCAVMACMLSCATDPGRSPAKEHASSSEQHISARPLPDIIASPYQETVYNGRPQAIEARCDDDTISLTINYYLTENSRWFNEKGTGFAPSEPGLYYVKISLPQGIVFESPAKDVFVDYQIRKAPVRIIAEKIQSANYNGDPKRVQAVSEPDLPLSYSYYPSLDLRQAAAEAFSNPDEEGRTSLITALQRFTRVERAPKEQGTYYVMVYFPGDSRYEPAMGEVDFTINPPIRRN